MGNPETALMNKIQVALSKKGLCFRANVGRVRMANGRFFDTGLPKGYSDLSGVRADDGKAFFVEVKTQTGKPSEDQINFIIQANKRNAIAGIARSVEEAIELVETGTNKSTKEMWDKL